MNLEALKHILHNVSICAFHPYIASSDAMMHAATTLKMAYCDTISDFVDRML